MKYFTFFEKKKIPTYDDPKDIRYGEIEFDYKKCSSCLLCIKLCPADALEKIENRPVLKKTGKNECMACGDCTAFCPEDAIVSTKSLHCYNGRYKTLEQKELSNPRL